MITLFENLLEGLAAAKVEFVLVGGVAVTLNGHLRTTEDMDILIDNHPRNIDRLLPVLTTFGEGSGGTYTAEDFTNEPGAIRVYEDFMLDMFVQMNGKTYADLKNFRVPFRLPSGATIFYLNVEGLMETKRGSVRPKDQSDMSILHGLKPEQRMTEDFRVDSIREEPVEDSDHDA
jgi:hypothetical protein